MNTMISLCFVRAPLPVIIPYSNTTYHCYYLAATFTLIITSQYYNSYNKIMWNEIVSYINSKLECYLETKPILRMRILHSPNDISKITLNTNDT